MRRPRPNLHPQAARLLGIRLMYAPPYRHVPHVPARPLVIRSSLRFPGAMRYCADMRRNLRRRIIMDIAQLLSGLALIPPFSFLAGKLIDDPLWFLISNHTSVLHHLRSDIYETLSLLLHGIRQLVDEEVPSCVTSLSSSVCTPFRR